MTPHIPAWAYQFAQAAGVVVGLAGAFLHGLFTPSPRERALEAALSALKGAHPMQFDIKKTIALLPLVPEAFGIEQEVAAGNLDDAAKAEALIARLAADVPKLFGALGASPALVTALGNADLYQNVYGVVEAVKNALPALEALVAKMEGKAPATPLAEQPA